MSRVSLLLLSRFTCLAAVLASGGTFFACRSQEPAAPPTSGANQPIQVSAAMREQLGIELVAARLATIGERSRAPGNLVVDENRTARLGALIDGRVVAVLADVGDRVRPGQVLAYLSSPAWQQARADLGKAKAEEAAARQARRFAEQVLARNRRLFDAGAISQQEVEKARLEHVLAQQRLAAARAELARAQQQLQQLAGAGPTAGEDQEWLAVSSPIAGAVIERSVSVGASVTPGTPLFVVSDLASLWLVAEVPETELYRLRSATTVEFRVAAYPGERFAAHLERIGDTLDPQTRRVRARLRVENNDGRLKPNMIATLELTSTEEEQAVVVPEASVQQLDGVPVVFVAEGEDTYRRRLVEVGRTEDGLTEIRSGLKPGELVVGKGAFLLKSTIVLQSHPEEP